jgi:hypothetical protein
MSTRFAVTNTASWYPNSHLVCDTSANRCLGGVGSNFYRCWVFPLYTPNGFTVLQEFPFDHPFHNGFFVGQSPVIVKEREGNLWMAPPRRSFDDAAFSKIGRVDMPAAPEIEIQECGVRLKYSGVWRDENEEPLLDEVRTVEFRTYDDATICDMTSRKIASYGKVEYPQTKYGSIGIRVEPRLLPPVGGVILAEGDRCGKASVIDEHGSRYVAYENAIGTHRCGVLITVPDGETKGPWFVRDYGMAMLNPTQNHSIVTPAGESWTIALRVVAYDGALDARRAQA